MIIFTYIFVQFIDLMILTERYALHEAFISHHVCKMKITEIKVEIAAIG
jgi:hypothetical protein